MSKNKKRFSTAKRLLLLLCAILLVYGCISLFWVLSMKLPYDKYSSKLDTIVEGGIISYQKDIDGYCYGLSKPGYLDFNSFLSVGKTGGLVVDVDEDGEIISSGGMDVTLFIWPDLWGNYEYGVFFQDPINDIWEQILIDGNINYLPKDSGNTEVNEYVLGLISENYNEIEIMMNGAKKVWGIKD